jgi:hypothetical protein
MMGSWVMEEKAPRTRRNENETLYSDFSFIGGCFDGTVHCARRDSSGGPGCENTGRKLDG